MQKGQVPRRRRCQCAAASASRTALIRWTFLREATVWQRSWLRLRLCLGCSGAARLELALNKALRGLHLSILTLYACRWVFFGPWLTCVSVYLAVCGYRVALMFFTAVIGAALLPAQGVRHMPNALRSPFRA